MRLICHMAVEFRLLMSEVLRLRPMLRKDGSYDIRIWRYLLAVDGPFGQFLSSVVVIVEVAVPADQGRRLSDRLQGNFRWILLRLWGWSGVSLKRRMTLKPIKTSSYSAAANDLIYSAIGFFLFLLKHRYTADSSADQWSVLFPTKMALIYTKLAQAIIENISAGLA